jgi:hypothetical protein
LNSLCFGEQIAKIHPNKTGKYYVSKLNGQGIIAEIAPILLLWIVFEKISLQTSIGSSSSINEATELTKTSLESSWCPL